VTDITDTLANIARVISEYDAAVKIARFILEGPPYNMACPEDYAVLEIKGYKATLRWPEANGGYYAGDGSLEWQSASFPADMLASSRDDLVAWKAGQIKMADARMKADADAEMKRWKEVQAIQERRTYEALKAKFEGVKA
jgi:hypothetical protein